MKSTEAGTWHEHLVVVVVVACPGVLISVCCLLCCGSLTLHRTTVNLKRVLYLISVHLMAVFDNGSFEFC